MSGGEMKSRVVGIMQPAIKRIYQEKIIFKAEAKMIDNNSFILKMTGPVSFCKYIFSQHGVIYAHSYGITPLITDAEVISWGKEM